MGFRYMLLHSRADDVPARELAGANVSSARDGKTIRQNTRLFAPERAWELPTPARGPLDAPELPAHHSVQLGCCIQRVTRPLGGPIPC